MITPTYFLGVSSSLLDMMAGSDAPSRPVRQNSLMPQAVMLVIFVGVLIMALQLENFDATLEHAVLKRCTAKE